MIVGFLRERKRPGHFARVLAVMCKYREVEFVYFTPDDLNIQTGKISGKTLINDSWKNKVIDVPQFIDIAPTLLSSNKHQEAVNYLQKTSTLSINERRPLPKDKQNDLFKDDEDVNKYLIPTHNVHSYKDLVRLLKKYKKVVFKPVNSTQGRDIFFIARKGRKYIVRYEKEETIYPKGKLKVFYNEIVGDRNFIIQKYIHSRDTEGNPVDCRIHVEKDKNGKWKTARNFVRIGVGQKIISNISQGGGVMSAQQYIKIRYGDNWRKIYDEIKIIASTLPYKIEEKLENEYMNFGFDIGMDEDGKLYLFEVNEYPLVTPAISEITLLRSGYYKYKLENAYNNRKYK